MDDAKTPKDEPKSLEAPAIVRPDHDKVTIVYPKDPIEIGKTLVDGNLQPVWVDPKQFIRTGEQNDKLSANIKASHHEAAMELARREIMARVEAWMQRVITQIAPDSILQSPERLESWLRENDLNWFEDSTPNHVKFILRRGPDVISEFNAALKPVHSPSNN